MAVAVKNATEARPTSNPFDRMQIAALGGCLYTVGSLLIVFMAIPKVWVALWGTLLGFQPTTFASYTLQGILMLAGAVGLVVLGGRLLGPKTQPGVRAGIFTALVSLLLILLLTRWYSIWAEHFVLNPEGVPVWGAKSIQGIGDFFVFLFATVLFLPSLLGGWSGAMVMTIVVGVILLGLFLRLFFSQRAERFLVGFEAQGWFSTTSLKKNQGVKVRRGTILGILLLFGSGIWTMISHNTLAAVSDWTLAIPFTGVSSFQVDDLSVWRIGSVRKEIEKQHSDWFTAKEPADELIESLQKLETSLEAAHLVPIIASGVGQAWGVPVLWQTGWVAEMRVKPPNLQISEVRQKLANDAYLKGSDEALKLVKDLKPTVLDLKDLEAVDKAAEKSKEIASKPITLNRYLLKTINQKLDPSTHVMLYDIYGLDKEYSTPVVVTIAKADEIEKERKKEGKTDLTRDKPQPISGPDTFATITLLPAVKFTLPLLLLGLTVWFAWRVVNLPVFADFLIATEGELNKVSWTTRRRLLQDTVVVLITLVLMSTYLFAMDQVWGRLLSWKPIGVIVFNPDNQQNKGTEKPW